MVTVTINCRWRQFFQYIWSSITWRITESLFIIRSLTYNDHMSNSYAIDFFMGPIFWIVDNFALVLGKVFIFGVIVLTTAVVVIAHWLGIPYWWERNQYATVFLVTFGYWLLVNIVFHYYKGVVTAPGYPPTRAVLIEAASICKKCISPKPPRTHHCSVCDRCILAMDHHCPWLNNCVGYFNARYFFLYMVYMVIGVTFVIIAGFDIGYVALWLNDTGVLIQHNDPDLIGHPVRKNQSGVLVPVMDVAEYDSVVFPREHILPVPIVTEAQRITANPLKKKAVIFMAVTCIAVFFALGTLIIMHGKQICRGETSVEAHINAPLRKTLGAGFQNPYDFGIQKNWKLFLGLTQGRTFVRHVLWPSSHVPVGTGLTWHVVFNVSKDWP